MKITKAHDVYTGGGIFLFYGILDNGNHFITDDYGATAITDIDPEPYIYDDTNTLDIADLYTGEHCIQELQGRDRLTFCDNLIAYLRKNYLENAMTGTEIDYYERVFKEEN